MNNKVVYSCITGGYDDIPVHKYVAPDWDYFLFTDDPDLIAKGKFEHWVVKPLVFDKLDNTRKNRWHKINTHKLFPQYDYSLYVDGNIVINNENPFKLFDELIKQNVLFAAPNHPERKCIYEEAAIVKQMQIDYPDVVDAEMEFLRGKRYPMNNGLSENNILLRKHNAIKKSMDLWWKMVEKFSKRDQLSLRYVLWKTKVPIIPIYTDENGFGIHRQSKDFTFIFKKTHNQDKIDNKEQIIETVPTRVLPKWFCRLVCCFIPVQSIRHKFKDKFMRR